MRILILTHKRLASLRDGCDLRVWHLCRELANRHELYLRFAGKLDRLFGYMVSSFFVSVAYPWYADYLVAYAVAERRIYSTSIRRGEGKRAV
jgi:hypothetical protein